MIQMKKKITHEISHDFYFNRIDDIQLCMFFHQKKNMHVRKFYRLIDGIYCVHLIIFLCNSTK